MTEKFEFIDAEYVAYQESDDEYVPSIVMLCRWMEVSRSGFYEWRSAPESATAKRRGILALSCGSHSMNRMRRTGTGGPRGPGGLGRGRRPELVRSIMRELGLEACQPRPWRSA